MHNQQETFESWQARDFLLDQVDKIPEQDDRLAALYDLIILQGEYYSEIEEED